mmetsp:Transcript_24980/g.45171  ORF Transcript_24980/g.45171 Transcript_24980/m.45171 type:complete len:200 (-) Transcript_24980:581-1180(-)
MRKFDDVDGSALLEDILSRIFPLGLGESRGEDDKLSRRSVFGLESPISVPMAADAVVSRGGDSLRRMLFSAGLAFHGGDCWKQTLSLAKFPVSGGKERVTLGLLSAGASFKRSFGLSGEGAASFFRRRLVRSILRRVNISSTLWHLFCRAASFAAITNVSSAFSFHHPSSAVIKSSSPSNSRWLKKALLCNFDRNIPPA